MRRLSFLAALLAVAPLNSCVNIFEPIDSPSGDAQLLSAARAAFDQGDLARARELYGKLGDNEIAIAETAFVSLDEIGLGIGPLAVAVSRGSSNPGAIITNLVEAAAATAGASSRSTILSSYSATTRIQSRELRGFVRFVTAMALAAELLAEQTGVQADRIFDKTDLASTSACASSSSVGCTAEGGCAVAGGGLPGTSGTEPTSPSDPNMSGTASLVKVLVAIQAASTGLSEMAVNNSTSAAFNLVTALVDAGLDPATQDRCFRWLLLGTTGGAVGAGR